MTVGRRSGDRAGASRVLGSLADWVTARYRPVLAIVGTLTVLLVAFVPTIDLNDEWVKYFDDRIAFRGDAEWGMEHLNGLYLLEFSVDAEGPEGISDPDTSTTSSASPSGCARNLRSRTCTAIRMSSSG